MPIIARTWRRRFATALATLAITATPLPAAPLELRSVQGTFADVLQDVEDAIIGQGLKITYRADVAAMLARTGRDLGFAPALSGGVVLQFCSARLSQQAIAADAANIAFCPYGVFVYQPAGESQRVFVGFRPLPEASAGSEESRRALQAVNRLLRRIVEEATGGW